MIKLFINNLPINVPLNTSILEACEKIGILIPRFCYHENLNVAGNCRMCLIEIENVPKPIASCAYPVMNQMRVFTNSILVKKSRENVLEFLLIHHPLDCPICDQGGECDLQEQTLLFGTEKSRFFFKKKSVKDIQCSSVIKLIMTRCIQCTRCVRFFDKIVGNGKLGLIGRGQNGEISLFFNTKLNSELSGNIVDLCPVGALTSKNYAFMFRSWETQFFETIDYTDSLSNKIKVNFKNQELIRILPLKTNLNDQWISDKTRFFLDGLKWNRLVEPIQNTQTQFFNIKWNRVLILIFNFLFLIKNKSSLNKILVISSNLNLETLETIKYFSYFFDFKILNENLTLIPSNTFYNLRNNICLANLQKIDLLLLIGLNPRMECTLYNLKLKQNFFEKSNFNVGTFGVQDDLLYSNLVLGNSYCFFIHLLEGKHFFCKQISFSSAPFFLLGSNLLKRIDFNLINDVYCISYHLVFLKKISNFNIGLMQSKINDLGIFSLINKVSIDLNKATSMFLFEVNSSVDNFLLKFSNVKNSFIYSFIQPKIQNSKIQLFIPTQSYFEQNGSILNFFGNLSITKQFYCLSNVPRSIFKIFNLFLFLIKKPIKKCNFYSFSNHDFSLLLIANYNIYQYNKKKVNETILQPKYESIYQTDLITKNSLILSKLNKEFRSFYKTFI